jgi:carbonic anhydrase
LTKSFKEFIMTTSEVITRLKDGNRRFMEDRLEPKPMDSPRRAELVGGQKPWAIILSCADSRVVPEAIFNTGMGDLFVVRVAGNVANTSSIASMEYAVAHLGSPVLMVLGHQHCGAVIAAVQGGDDGPNINHLLAHIKPAMENAGEGATVDEIIRKNIEITAKTLLELSPIIKRAVEERELQIITAYYHLDTGEVEFQSG